MQLLSLTPLASLGGGFSGRTLEVTQLTNPAPAFGLLPGISYDIYIGDLLYSSAIGGKI